MPHRRTLALFVLALSVTACDGRPPGGPISVYPVSGQVVYQGQPVAGAMVVFHPGAATEVTSTPTPTSTPEGGAPSGSPVPTATTDVEGRFRLHTYVGDDGAPAGDYKVSIVLAGRSEGRNHLARNTSAISTIVLPARYGDPAQSGLKATVKPDANTLPTFSL